MIKKTNRVLAILIALLLISLSTSALAAEVTLKLDEGHITIERKADGTYSVQQQTTQQATLQNYTGDTSFTVTQNGNTATGNTITITAAAGQTAKVTLSGVNIDVSHSSKAAVSTGGDGDVIIELKGQNTVKSGEGHAGVEKGNAGNLTIADDDNDGSLEAVGGNTAAGIGGGLNGHGSNITISGGTITAKSGGNGGGAGIGDGGSYLDGQPVNGADLRQTNSNLLNVSGLEAGAIITCYEQGTEIPKSILYQIFKANILTGDTIEIAVSKTWYDDNAGAQSIKVGLYADGAKVAEKDITRNEGWYHSFKNIPVKDSNSKPINYTVKEENVPDGWTPYYYTAGLHKGKLIFQIHNVPTDNTGAIRVSKELSGEGAEKDKEFAFTVTLLEYLDSNEVLDGGEHGYYPLGGIYTFGGFEFRDGKVTLGLKGGESVTISGIPAEYDYTVTESNNYGYTVTSENDKGTIRAKDTAEVKFTNTKSAAPTVSPSPTPYNGGGGYYYPTTTPVPVTVIPPKTGDMTIWQSILHFLGIR